MSLVRSARAAEAPLRVIVFPGLHNLALDAGCLNVNREFTRNSQVPRDGPRKRPDIAYTAPDNGVALVESAKVDVVFVTGGGSSLNGL